MQIIKIKDFKNQRSSIKDIELPTAKFNNLKLCRYLFFNLGFIKHLGSSTQYDYIGRLGKCRPNSRC